MFNHSQTNPLLARRNRTRAVTISATAVLAILAAGTFAVSAKTATFSEAPITMASAQQAQPEPMQVAQGSQGQRRQVRVIPLFNVPQNQTGK